MANKFTRFLTGFTSGLTNPKGISSDYRHATRLFIDDTFRLSPRTKFNYFVRFEIDRTAFKAPKFGNKEIEEFGMLVKRTDLPSFKFDTETKHQYNRKKILYKMINYDPINFTFHDDSAGIVNALWAIYYGYYIADRNTASVRDVGSNIIAPYGNTKYRQTGTKFDDFRYGLDNNISVDLFKSITLYTMSRQRFLSYTLVNPKITSWKHSEMDYSQSAEPAENTMDVEYEAVVYGGGRVSDGIKGFADLHYDLTPSPLTIAGGGVESVVGQGGLLDGLESIFGALGSGQAFDSPQNFLSTAIAAANTYKNFKNLSSDDLKREAVNIISSPAGVSTIAGIAGAIFPKNDPSNQETTATQKNLTDTQGSS